MSLSLVLHFLIDLSLVEAVATSISNSVEWDRDFFRIQEDKSQGWGRNLELS